MSEQFEPHAEMPPEPVLSEAETRRLVEQIEARIKATEKLERAIATRPQPSAEPVAWMYTKEGALDEYGQPKVILLDYDTPAAIADGWTETPLYPASALEGARREGWDAMRQAACDLVGLVMTEADINGRDEVSDDLYGIQCRLSVLEPSALQENTNG